MRRSTLLLLAFLVFSGSVFAACGGDDTTDTGDSADDSPSSGG